MAALTNANRKALWAQFMEQASAEREPLAGMEKADLRAAVDAIDDWIEANAASFNRALPQPARSALTVSQKLRLFMEVARRRLEVI